MKTTVSHTLALLYGLLASAFLYFIILSLRMHAPEASIFIACFGLSSIFFGFEVARIKMNELELSRDQSLSLHNIFLPITVVTMSLCWVVAQIWFGLGGFFVTLSLIYFFPILGYCGVRALISAMEMKRRRGYRRIRR